MAEKRLTTFDATLLVMGGILGVGIFFTPQIVAERAHEEWAFMTMWIIGGVFALAAAMTFAEWGATLPRAGGWYVFLRESLGRLPAFLFAWTVLLVISTGTIARVARFAAGAIDRAWVDVDFGEGGQTWIAAALITSVTLACLAGVKASAVFQNVIMVTKLLAIGALIVAGWAFVAPAGPPLEVVPTADKPPLASGMLASLLPVFFAYGGWQMVCYIAPQVRDPERTLPRAILFGVTGVIVVYVLLACSYVRVLGIDAIAADPGFATTLGQRVFGPSGVVALNLGFAVSATGWLVVTILGSPWLYVAMAREGLFFESFGKCTERAAPARALAMQWVIAMVYLIFAADLSFLVDSVVFSEWIFHGLVAWGLLRFRRRHPDAPRPFRSPLYPLAPILYLLAAVLAVGSKIVERDLRVTLLGGAVLGVGLVAYVLWNRPRSTGVDGTPR